ncbi:hypothetical protein VTG60DRAFT_2462 [Thermothelomyces hinnuleus]
MLPILHISQLRQRYLRKLTFLAVPVPAAGDIWVHPRRRGGIVPRGRKQSWGLPGTGRRERCKRDGILYVYWSVKRCINDAFDHLGHPRPASIRNRTSPRANSKSDDHGHGRGDGNNNQHADADRQAPDR